MVLIRALSPCFASECDDRERTVDAGLKCNIWIEAQADGFSKLFEESFDG